MSMVVLDTDVWSFVFKRDSRAERYRVHLEGVSEEGMRGGKRKGPSRNNFPFSTLAKIIPRRFDRVRQSLVEGACSEPVKSATSPFRSQQNLFNLAWSPSSLTEIL